MDDLYYRRASPSCSKRCRRHLSKVLDNPVFQSFVLLLVLITCLLVTAELLLVYNKLDVGEEDKNLVETILRYVVLTILAFFATEVMVRAGSLGPKYLRRWVEVLDGLVVVTTFGVDLALLLTESNMAGLQATAYFILFRFVRLASIVTSIQRRARKKAEYMEMAERNARRRTELKLQQMRHIAQQQKEEIDSLQSSLAKAGGEGAKKHQNKSVQTGLTGADDDHHHSLPAVEREQRDLPDPPSQSSGGPSAAAAVGAAEESGDGNEDGAQSAEEVSETESETASREDAPAGGETPPGRVAADGAGEAQSAEGGGERLLADPRGGGDLPAPATPPAAGGQGVVNQAFTMDEDSGATAPPTPPPGEGEGAELTASQQLVLELAEIERLSKEAMAQPPPTKSSSSQESSSIPTTSL